MIQVWHLHIYDENLLLYQITVVLYCSVFPNTFPRDTDSAHFGLVLFLIHLLMG